MASDRTGRRRILLMRHGHVDYFAQQAAGGDPRDVELTPEGREQAAAAAEALSEIDFDLAVSSGLPRTRQTAEIVLAAHSSPPALSEEPELEEIRGGWADANSRAELAARLAYAFEVAAEPGATFLDGGEPFSEVYARVSGALERLLTHGSWRRALVVAHEGVNRVAMGWACGGGLGAIGAFEQDLACVNVLDFDLTPRPDGEGLQIERRIIKAVNVTPYDYLKHGMARTSLEALFDL
ncbi:MAG: histidine phosphatase family protein [Pseudomonadota bacterium]